MNGNLVIVMQSIAIKNGKNYDLTLGENTMKKNICSILMGALLTSQLMACSQSAEKSITPTPITTIDISQSDLSLEKQKDKMQVCDLTKCLGNYFSVRDKLNLENLTWLDIGKELGESRVSYLHVATKDYDKKSNQYCIGDITFASSKKECDKFLGDAKEETAGRKVYRYKEDYEIEIEFKGNKIKEMGIYLHNKKQAMKTYEIGDFVMQGCKIVKYKNAYESEEKVVLPSDTVAIKSDAFEIERNPDFEAKKLQIHIPKEVYLEPYSFSGLGPIEVTFEEGRTKIEKGSFANACDKGKYDINVTLPTSVKTISAEAFYNMETGEWLNLWMQEGVEVIEREALVGIKCDLPTTIRTLEKKALQHWMPETNFGLPEGVEEIGDECFYFDIAREKFKIPASVKKIGINPFSYYEAHCTPGVEVDSSNPYFKSDENGWLFSKDGKELYLAWAYEGELIIPEGVEYIKCDLLGGPDRGRNFPVKKPKTLKQDLYQ